MFAAHMTSHDLIAQALEKQQAQEEQQRQSITEIMKNPSKVVLLKVTIPIDTNNIPLIFDNILCYCRIWLDRVKWMMTFNQRSLRSVPNMERLLSVLCMR